jgi:hypothetical protein
MPVKYQEPTYEQLTFESMPRWGKHVRKFGFISFASIVTFFDLTIGVFAQADATKMLEGCWTNSGDCANGLNFIEASQCGLIVKADFWVGSRFRRESPATARVLRLW